MVRFLLQADGRQPFSGGVGVHPRLPGGYGGRGDQPEEEEETRVPWHGVPFHRQSAGTSGTLGRGSSTQSSSVVMPYH